MNLQAIEEKFADIALKVIDFETVSDGFFSYNIIDFEFELDDEDCQNIFTGECAKMVFQDQIKVKHGDNVFYAFQKRISSWIGEKND